MVKTFQRLAAIEAIKQLKARYFRTMDTRDFDAMAAVFCRDAVFDCSEGFGCLPVGGAWRGEVWVDSNTEAHGIIAMEDVIRGLDRATMLVHGAGHYHERYRVEDGEWRIAETKLTRLFLDRPG